MGDTALLLEPVIRLLAEFGYRMLREEFGSRASGRHLPGERLGSVLAYHDRVGVLGFRVRPCATGAFESAGLVHAVESNRAFEQNPLFEQHLASCDRRAPSAARLAIWLDPRFPAHSSTFMVVPADRADRSSRQRLAQHPMLCHRTRDLIAILGIGFAEVPDRTFDDIFAAHLRQAGCDVRDQSLLLLIAHQPVEISGLNEVIVVAMVHKCMIFGEPRDLDRRPQRLARLLRTAVAVGFAVLLATVVA